MHIYLFLFCMLILFCLYLLLSFVYFKQVTENICLIYEPAQHQIVNKAVVSSVPIRRDQIFLFLSLSKLISVALYLENWAMRDADNYYMSSQKLSIVPIK